MSAVIDKELKSLISKKFLKVIPSAQFQHVLMHLGMRDETAAVVVGESGNLMGIFSEKDIAKTLVDRIPRKTPISELMKRKVAALDFSECFVSHAKFMIDEDLPLLPVVQNGVVIGVLKRESVISVIYKAFLSSRNVIA